jgi:glycosyltransferase involved in cell wall biosynthesis
LLLDYFYDAGLHTPEALLRRYDSLTYWCASLRAAGADRVTVLQRYATDADLTRDGVEYLFRAGGGRAFPPIWSPLGRINRAAAALRPDVVHVNGLLFPAAMLGLRRALPRASAIVVQEHTDMLRSARGPGDLKGHARRLLQRAGFGAADAFMFTAAELARPWRAAGIIGPRQPVYEVLESSRPVRRIPRAEARARGRVGGNPAVLWVGRLNAQKDPLTVLDGFERALAQLPQAQLAMCFPTYDLLPQIQARLAAAPALAERVDLLGEQPFDEIVALLCAADIFVLGSRRESAGYALIEAIACGTVPVVTDIPAFRTITANGTLGRLWPPGDAGAFALALAEMGRRDLAPLRAALIEHFDRELSWDAVGARALAVYREVAARRA